MNILLLGTNGQKNLGDDILLEVFLRNLKSRKSEEDIVFTVNSYSPEETKHMHREYGIKTFHTAKDLLSLPGIIIKSDVIVFGGGSIVKELYKSTGRSKYSSMMMIYSLVVFARLVNKKIIFSNIGIGPIDTWLGKKITKSIFKRVALLAFRDEKSMALAKDIDSLAAKKMRVVPDAVFSLKKDPSVNKKEKSETITIGLNLNHDIANPSNWENFLNQLESVFLAIHKKKKIRVVGIPMQYGFNIHNDLVVLKVFLERLEKQGINVEVRDDIKSSKALQEVYGEVDVIFCERFHSAIFSIITKTPFIALSYDVKVSSLMEDNDMSSYCFDINSRFNEEDFIRVFDEMIQNPDDQIKRIEKSYSVNHREVTEYFEDLAQAVDA